MTVTFFCERCGKQDLPGLMYGMCNDCLNELILLREDDTVHYPSGTGAGEGSFVRFESTPDGLGRNYDKMVIKTESGNLVTRRGRSVLTLLTQAELIRREQESVAAMEALFKAHFPEIP